MYTSKEFSKQLKENGCELESEKVYIKKNNRRIVRLKNNTKKDINDFMLCWGKGVLIYPTYDILNDICVKYAKEFFGEELIEKKEGCPFCYHKGNRYRAYHYYPIEIIKYHFDKSSQEEIEKYIWDNCKFNK